MILKILKVGMTVGLMDGVAASLNSYLATGTTPDRVFKYVASGVFGMAAFTEGFAMVTWGFTLHCAIAVTWTTFYFILATRFQHLIKYYLLSGIVYGVIVWAVMRFLVVPISNTPAINYTVQGTLIMIGIHIFVIGLPMSYWVRRCLRNGDNKPF